ncbi:uncharacterized protein LOC143213869 [Lasioglossum baleicum]|uniref:uncharacterized protein LOC143213869 n=1 Tax=Lasioglossum baleicum TaxID=434251 RepID=UPI003FCD710B
MTSKESLINTTKLSQPSQDSGPQDSCSESVKESAFSQPATKSGSRSERDEELADSMVDPNHCSPPSNDIHSNKNGSTEAGMVHRRFTFSCSLCHSRGSLVDIDHRLTSELNPRGPLIDQSVCFKGGARSGLLLSLRKFDWRISPTYISQAVNYDRQLEARITGTLTDTR